MSKSPGSAESESCGEWRASGALSLLFCVPGPPLDPSLSHAAVIPPPPPLQLFFSFPVPPLLLSVFVSLSRSFPLYSSFPVLVAVFSFSISVPCCLSLSSSLSVCWVVFFFLLLIPLPCSVPSSHSRSVVLCVTRPSPCGFLFLLLCASVLLPGSNFLFSVFLLFCLWLFFLFSTSLLLPTLTFLSLTFFPLPSTSAFLRPCTPFPPSRSITLSCSPSLPFPFYPSDVCVPQVPL